MRTKNPDQKLNYYEDADQGLEYKYATEDGDLFWRDPRAGTTAWHLAVGKERKRIMERVKENPSVVKVR